MKFIIDKEILQKYPELNLGVVIAQGIDNAVKSDEVINQVREIEKKIREKHNTETLSQIPKIEAWREAYKSFGAKPKKYKSSVEALYRMILSGIDLRHINKLVDIYNYISLKYMIPAGGDDIDKVEGDITLTFAQGNEPFIELNSREVKFPKPGEVVYKDDKEVLCRRWNWRECDKTKMTEQTTNAALVVEGLPPFTKEEIEQIVKELAALIQKYCTGAIMHFILNNYNYEIDI
jgi:DNA/RNA-binding domain of Phe-tRNA-synthetase-like protein